ncbi:MAG: hypothetical protein Q4B10_01915 [Actinomycetaceae bacterium]|nr:hypothetical protein [Actinomycetaceae bacterium]
MSTTDPYLSSDQALESLLAQTRADLTQRALGEVDRVNEDLNNLLYRVSGTRRSARAQALRGEADTSATLRPLIAGADLEMLGVPGSISSLHPQTLDELIEFIPDAQPVTAQPGGVIVVLGTLETATETLQAATRLARRTPGVAHVVLGCPKSIIPGNHERVRSADEVGETLAEHPDATTYLVLIDSPQAAHARMSEKLAEAAGAGRVWACVDAGADVRSLDEWLWHLPGGLRATDLAVAGIWEAERPACVLELATAVGLLDLAPATPDMWRIILTRRLREDGWRG